MVSLIVSHSALRETESFAAAFQLSRPAHVISPRPSQWTKDSATTPNSGRIAKKPNRRSAGAAIHLLGPVGRARRRAPDRADEDPASTTRAESSAGMVTGWRPSLRRTPRRSA